MARASEFLVLALDIGSSSTRSSLFNERGVPLAATHAKREYSIRYTPEGGAELHPQRLLRAVKSCVAETLRAKPAAEIRAVSGCAFWHSLLGLDRKGLPVTPLLTWADSRSSPDAVQLRTELREREIQLRTGCMLRSPFWPAKLRWLQRTKPAVFKRVSRWVSPADWIWEELFGTSGTSHSMASGTGLYDLRERVWDVELCRRSGIRPEQLAQVFNGRTEARPSGGTRRGESVPEIFLPLGDGVASNLGSGADRDGRIAINIGTSAAVRVVETGARGKFPFGLFRYVVDAERTLLGGAISNGGNLRRWCLRELHLSEEAAAKALSRRAAATDTLDVLPHWVTERSPTWSEEVQGTVTGLTQSTTAPELLRALTTSTYYRLADILELIEKHTGTRGEVIVSGGVLKSPASLKILADATGRDLRVARERESSIRGVAIFALEGLGAEVKPLRAGRVVRHSAAFAELHAKRRERQRRLERVMTTL